MDDKRKQEILNAVDSAWAEKTAQAQGGPVIKDSYTKDEVVALLKQASVGLSEEDREKAYMEGCLDGMRHYAEKTAQDPRAPYGPHSPTLDHHIMGMGTDKANQVVEGAAELEMRVDPDQSGMAAVDPTEGAGAGGDGGGGQAAAMGGGGGEPKVASVQSEEALWEELIKNAMEDEGGGAGGGAGYEPGVIPASAAAAGTGVDGDGDPKHPDFSKNVKRDRDVSLGQALRAQIQGALGAG